MIVLAFAAPDNHAHDHHDMQPFLKGLVDANDSCMNSFDVASSNLTLLPHTSLVESQLVALQDVSVTSSTLPWSTRNNSIQSSSLELPLQSRLNLTHLLESFLSLLLHRAADFLVFNRLSALGLSPPSDRRAVMCFVPCSEWCSVDLDNGRPCQGVGSDEFIVRGMESDNYDTDFAGNALGAPGEVAGLETQGAVFFVAAAGADKMDALVADSGVGWLAAFLKCSAD